MTPRATLARSIVKLAGILESRYRATKSINEVTRRYDDLLTRLVIDAANGNATSRSIRAEMRDAVMEMGREAYVEGASEGGLDEEDFDKANEDEIRDWILSQVEHINDFADAAVAVSKVEGKDERKDARDGMLGRVEAWVEQLRYIGNLGYLAAQGDPPLTFDGDDGTESCADCQKYKGQTHKKSWWQSRGLLERNGNTNYECGRWDNCHHNFYNKKGEMVL